jgi:hypothetical protein
MDAADLFKTAPKEVTRFFDAKDNRPTFDWRDIAPAEHAFSWTVAKSAGYDILDDIRTAMSDAIRNRTSFEEFQRNLMPVLQAKGWWGKALAIDPETGEEKLVQLGSPRRLRTIYWANTMTAHAAGEWERTERNKAFLPFLVYTLSTAERKRLEHEGWVGIVAAVDDPIWDRLYPPNGWGCMCGVRQISRREATSLGWTPDQPVTPLIEKPWHNTRTGETVMVPVGVDPGWDTNPGKHRGQNVSRFLHERLDSMPAERQKIAVEDIVRSPVLDAMVEDRMPRSFLPVAQLPDIVVREFQTSTSIVRLSTDSIKHILVEHAERGLEIDDFRSAIGIITNPTALIRRPGTPSVVIVGQSEGSWWRVAVKMANQGKEWWMTSFHRKSEAETLKVIERSRRANELIE